MKLTDFGIAGLRESTTSQVAYSPSYAPPESFDAYRNANGQLVDLRDGRSDFYSLAASLFTLVTGAPPFDGTQLAMMRQIAETPVPATGYPALDGFLRTAMAKRPEHRYQSAEAFMEALRAVRANPAAANPVVTPPQAAPVVQGIPPRPRPVTADGLDERDARTVSGQALLDDSARPPSRRPAVVFLSLLGLTMIGVIMAAVIFNSNDGGETPAVDQADDATQPTDEQTADDPALDNAGDAASSLDAAATSGDGVVTFTGHTERVRAALELPDGRIASAGDDGVLLWDPADPEATPAVYQGHGQVFSVLDMILLSDGRIASADSRAVQIWDPANPDVTIATYGDTQAVGSLVTSLVELPDGRIASADSGQINVWHPDDPDTTVAVYSGHGSGLVSALTVLPDGRIASAVGPTVHIWDADDPGSAQVVYTGHDNSEELAAVLNADNEPDDPTLSASVTVTAIVGLADGRIVSAGRDGFRNPIHIWDPESPDEPLETRVLSEYAKELLVLADGRIADGDDDGEVTIWDLDDAQDSEAAYSGHTGAIWGITQLSDGRIVTVGDDTTVQIWNPSCEGVNPGFGPFDQLLCLQS